MPAPFQMNPATSKDISAIVALVESVYRGESSQQGWTTEADLLEGQRVDESMVGEMLSRPNTLLLVFQDEGVIQGCVYLERKGDAALLGLLSVDVRQQGRKLGQKILSYCESYILREWKLNAVLIHVLWQRVELISWYERRGFKKTGAEKPFPSDHKFGIPKVQDLYFLEMKKML